MELIKKHYEKVLLGLVLLGLAVAAALLPLKIATEKQDLEEQRKTKTETLVKPLPALEQTRYQSALQRLQTAISLNFSGVPKHNLVNPVPWQKATDGRLIPIRTGGEVGPDAVIITQITPLYLILSFDSVTGTGFLVGAENEAAPTPEKRRKKQSYATLNNKSELFTLREVKGPPTSPTELILELNDSGKRVSIKPESPYKRVEGYAADLKYDPERKTWLNRRLGSALGFFAGDEYNVVAITESDVVLSAKSTGKKTTIKFNPTAKPR